MEILIIALIFTLIGMVFGALLATDGHGNARISKTKYNRE